MTDFYIKKPQPSEELALSWLKEVSLKKAEDSQDHWSLDLSRKAIAWATPTVAQQAADAEREACCKWLEQQPAFIPTSVLIRDLRAARRPKPKSKLQIAEELLERHEDGWVPSAAQWHTIREGLAEGRRALESIPDATP